MASADVPDDELMARGAAGDEAALLVLVRRWERPVFVFLARMLGSAEDAQDLGQETFLRMCREAPRYRPDGKFKSWLFRIAGNLARSHLRRRKIVDWIRFDPSRHEVAASEDEGADRAIELKETQGAVRRSLAKLPDRQRQALVLKTYEGLSYREIAEAMDATLPAVESLLQRATAALRKDLAGGEFAP
jgi:RNA polymerase sigma-70 factor (ECF subfamily)